MSNRKCSKSEVYNVLSAVPIAFSVLYVCLCIILSFYFSILRFLFRLPIQFLFILFKTHSAHSRSLSLASFSPSKISMHVISAFLAFSAFQIHFLSLSLRVDAAEIENRTEQNGIVFWFCFTAIESSSSSLSSYTSSSSFICFWLVFIASTISFFPVVLPLRHTHFSLLSIYFSMLTADVSCMCLHMSFVYLYSQV